MNLKMCGWKLLFSAFFERLQSCWLSGCDHGVMEDLLFVQAKTSHNAPTWPNQTPRKNITNMENIRIIPNNVKNHQKYRIPVCFSLHLHSSVMIVHTNEMS